MLGENCPVVTPTTEDSSMSLAEQSDIPGESTAPVQPESSVMTQPSTESQQISSPSQGEAGGGALPQGVGRALILIQIQAQSLEMRVSLSWSLRLGLMHRWRALLACLLGRICLLFRRLGLIRSRTLKSQEQLLRSRGQLHLQRRIKLKRKLHHLTLRNQKNKYLRIRNLRNH